MNRVDLERAYLLHLRPYRDTSALLELLTPGFGRVGAVARGVRSGGRRGGQWRALLQPFTPILVSWSGRGELKTLREIDGRAGLALSGERLYAGLYVNELTLRLLHRDDPHPELFGYYEHCLAALADGDPLEQQLRRYEFRLLNSLGYGLVLDADARSGEPVDADGWYLFEADRGVVRCPEPGDRPEVFAGRDLLAMAAGEFDERALRAAKRLCRQALQPLLGAEPLHSRQLFLGSSRE